MIIFNNMSFKYKEPIFTDLSLEILENKIGIIGVNGIGKTTLLKLLNKEIKVKTGSIQTNIPTYRVEFDLEKYKRFTIQDIVDIASRLSSFDCSNAKAIIKELNIDKYMSYNIGNLSKGTSKKVSILLGLMTKNRILLIDEPFEAMDEATKQNLVLIFKKCERQLVIVSHDMEYLQNSVEKMYEVRNESLIAVDKG